MVQGTEFVGEPWHHRLASITRIIQTIIQYSSPEFSNACLYDCMCREQWDGPRPGPEGAVEFTGVDQVRQHTVRYRVA